MLEYLPKTFSTIGSITVANMPVEFTACVSSRFFIHLRYGNASEKWRSGVIFSYMAVSMESPFIMKDKSSARKNAAEYADSLLENFFKAR